MSGRHSKSPSLPLSLPLSLPSVTRSGRPARAAGLERVVHRLEGRGTALRRTAGGFAAMALVGASLSLAAAPGEAVGGPLARAAKPEFGGYSSTSTAAPVRLEIYEPTIPLPAEPQLELSVGYSAVAADMASTRSRASYLWPGAPIGEGFKTIADQLMLPSQIGETGYPVQVNAIFPGDQTKESQEPAPGMIQRAEAAQDVSRADNGFSTDGETKGDGTGSGSGGTPGVPTVPGVPALPGLSSLTGSSTGSSKAPTDQQARAAAPVLPAPLAAVVDVGGFSSTSKTDNKTDATAYSRAEATDITLLGGVVTIEGVKTVSTVTSDGKTGKAVGKADFGDIVVAGQRFTYGSDGFEAAGQSGPALPGLPAQGVDLLKELGVTISVPKAEYTQDKDAAAVTMPGLKIELDLKKLRGRDGGLSSTLNDVLGQLPGELDQVKSPLQAAVFASPRMVVFLGTSAAGTDTSEAIVPPPIPTVPTDTQTDDTGTDTTPAVAPPGDTGSGDTAPVDSAPVDPTVPVEEAAPIQAAITPVAATPPGLPPLLSFPGFLLYGGLLGAAVAGFFVRRLGALALGATGSCPHGLTSGLPDLRKA